MKTIYLLRHGKPDYPKASFLSGHDFGRWIDRFNNKGITSDSNPPKEVIKLASNCEKILCSTLQRSTESAHKLATPAFVIADSLFVEVDIPQPKPKTLKLPLCLWLLSMRIAWFLGYTKNCNSISEETKRAYSCGRKLEKYSEKHSQIMLIGHGFINRFIGRYLSENGWQKNKLNKEKYWSLYQYSNEL